ncbi:MAG TPA: hypothetical protein VIQ79_35965, partial [Kribbella sp.]
MPLRGASVEHLRADVFDADSGTAPAAAGEVQRHRRAQLVLSEWRRAVAESRISRSIRPRNRRLWRLVDALDPTSGPLFRRGPSRDDISDFVNGGSSHPWFGNSAAPLVAELAAAYDSRGAGAGAASLLPSSQALPGAGPADASSGNGSSPARPSQRLAGLEASTKC